MYNDVSICFETLVTTYKAVRRRLWSNCLYQHQHCIHTAARHLRWDLRDKRTGGFCPTALAFLQWRMLWEGCGSPASLVAPQAKELYGILGWHLARPAPTPRHWLATTKTWVTARIFANTIWEAFNRLLNDAEVLAKQDEVLWNQTCGPVAQDCLWAVAGHDCVDAPATVFVRCAKPVRVRKLDKRARQLHCALHDQQLARIAQ